MRFSACISPSTVGFLLLVLARPSIASSGPSQPQLRRKAGGIVEERTFLDPLFSLFGKRDDCGTQFGPTYVDCGRDGCYQPSLGDVCCSDVSSYCPAGTYCIGLECCPNGLTSACCDLGEGCPANVSDYYSTAAPTLTSEAPTTSLPVSISTSLKASTSIAAVLSTSSSSPSPIPATPKSTSSAVLKSASSVSTTGISGVTSSASSTGAAATFSPASAAKGKAFELGFGTAAVAVLCIVGFVAGLM